MKHAWELLNYLNTLASTNIDTIHENVSSSDERVLFPAIEVDEQMLGLVSRLSCADARQTPRLRSVFDGVRCEH